MVRLCGEDFLHDVIRVDLPAGMDNFDLADLRSVERVVLHGNDVHDDDVRAVAALPRLKHLKVVSHRPYGRFRQTNITDESLKLLSQLPALESVVLEGCCFSPQGVNLLLRAPRLKLARIHGVDYDGLHRIEVPANVRVEFSQSQLAVLPAPYEDRVFSFVGGQLVGRTRKP